MTFLFIYILLLRKISQQRLLLFIFLQLLERFVFGILGGCFCFLLLFFLMQDLISSVHAHCVISQVCAERIHPAPATRINGLKKYIESQTEGRDNWETLTIISCAHKSLSWCFTDSVCLPVQKKKCFCTKRKNPFTIK